MRLKKRIHEISKPISQLFGDLIKNIINETPNNWQYNSISNFWNRGIIRWNDVSPPNRIHSLFHLGQLIRTLSFGTEMGKEWKIERNLIGLYSYFWIVFNLLEFLSYDQSISNLEYKKEEEGLEIDLLLNFHLKWKLDHYPK